MAQLYNPATQQYETVPDDQVVERVRTGGFNFADDAMVPIVIPGGKKHKIEAKYARRAFELGATFVGAAEAREDELREEYSSGWDNTLAAWALGTLSGATLSLSNAALVGMGITTKETLDALKKYQTGAYYGGDVIGSAAMIFGTGGLGGAAKAATTAGRIAQTANIVGRTARGAAAAGRGVTKFAMGTAPSAARMRGAKGLGLLTEGAIDAGAYAAGEHLSEVMMGNPNANAESLISNVGLSMAMGGGFSLLVPGGAAIGTYGKEKMGDMFTTFYRSVFGGDINNPTAAQDALAKALVSETTPVGKKLTADEYEIEYQKALKKIEMTADGTSYRLTQDNVALKYQTDIVKLEDQLSKVELAKKELTDAFTQDKDAWEALKQKHINQLRDAQDQLEGIDNIQANEIAKKLAKFEKMELAQQHREILKKFKGEEKLLKEARKQLDIDYKAAKETFQATGETEKSGYQKIKDRAFDPNNPFNVVDNMQRLDDSVEEISELLMGETRTNGLIGKIESGVNEGEYADDVVRTVFGVLHEARKRAKADRQGLPKGQAKIDNGETVINNIQNQVIETVERVLKIQAPRAPAKPGKKKGKLDTDRFFGETQTNARMTPDLDRELKQELFKVLDKGRKQLGDLAFGRNVEGTLNWDVKTVLKDLWSDVTTMQSHKAFGTAGTELKRVNQAWEDMIEARKNFSSKFRGTVVKNGRKQIDPKKVKTFVINAGNKAVAMEHRVLNEVFGTYGNAGERMFSLVDRLDIAMPTHLRERWLAATEDFNISYAEIAEANQVTSLIDELVKTKQKPADIEAERILAAKAAHLTGDYNTASKLGRKLDENENALRELNEGQLAEEKLRSERQIRGAVEAEQDRLLQVARHENTDGPRDTVMSRIKEIEEQQERLRRASAEDTVSIKRELSDLEDQKTALTKEAMGLQKPETYRPRLLDEQVGAMGQLQTHGTTSPMGMAGFMLGGGWMGGAAATIGTSSIIQKMRRVVNHERRYLALMDTHDTLVRFQERRKKTIRDFVRGKMDRYLKDSKPSKFSVILASAAKSADFGGLLEPTSDDEFTAAVERLNAIEANPEMKAKLIDQAVGTMDDFAPEHANATRMKLAQGYSLMASKAPKKPATELYRLNPTEWEAADSEKSRFKGDADFIEDWLSAFTDRAANKTLAAHEVATWKEWSPKSYQECVQQCIEEIGQLEEPMDAGTRAVVAVLIPGIDPTRSGSYMNALNATRAQGQPAKPNPQSAALKKVPQSHMTPSQMRYT